MTFIRSHSMLSASMDNINDGFILRHEEDDVANEKQKQEPEDPPTTTNSSSSSAAAQELSLLDENHTEINGVPSTVYESKEPRLYDKKTEEEGCKQIMSALTPSEIATMSDPNLPLRHLRADKCNIPTAIQRIKNAIQWRNEFGVQNMLRAVHNPTTPQDHELRNIIKKESETGKIYVRGHDREGRAIMYMYQKRENTNHPKHNIMHLVYEIERAIACTERNGYEKIVVVLDFLGWKMRHASSMEVTKMTIHILQDCYVERVKRIYFTNPPAVFRAFFNMVKVFLDPGTKDKIKFVTDTAKNRKAVEEYFDVETCEKCLFGDTDLKKKFDAEEYFDVPMHVSFDENRNN